jgi:putative ABC transport system permease protein
MAAAAVLTVVLAVGGTVAVFTLLDAVVLRTLPYRDADRLVAVWINVTAIADEVGIQDPRREYTNLDTHRDLRAMTTTLDGLAAFVSWAPPFRSDDGMQRIPGAVMTWNALGVLGVTPVAGRLFTEEDGPGADQCTVTISEGFWQRHFAADPSVVGGQIQLGGEVCNVVGIVPASFRFPFLPGAEIFRTMRAPGNDRGSAYIRQFGRLAEEVTIEQAQAELDTVAASLRAQYPAAYRGHELFVERLQESLNRGSRNQVLLIQAVALFVFVIAIANLANVMVARVLARSDDFGVRFALGASGWRQFRLLWMENIVLVSLGAVGGIALAYAGVDALTQALPAGFTDAWDVRLGGRSIAVAIGAALLSATLMAGTAYVVLKRSGLPLGTAGGGGRVAGDRTGRHITGTLVASNFAVGLAVTVTAVLLLQSYQRLAAVDPGFSTDGVVSGLVALPEYGYPNAAALFSAYERLVAQLEQIPGVNAAAVASAVPLGSSNNDTFVLVEGQPTTREDGRAHTWLTRASEDYFRAMGVGLREGRAFEAADRISGRRIAIVNEAFAREYLGGRPAASVRVALGPPDQPRWFDIVGVADNVRYFDLAQPETPALYLPAWVEPDRGMYVVVRTTRDTPSIVPDMRRAVATFDSDLVLVDVRAMSERVDGRLVAPRTFSRLSLVFALTALLLAAVGVYGTLAQSVLRRKRELGIRRALGARDRDVLLQVVRQGMVLAVIGLAAGVPLTMLLGRWLSTVLYSVTPGEPRAWVLAFVALILVAGIAVLFPGYRAARIPPMQALRED